VGVEGISISQGSGRKICFRWPRSFYKLTIAILIVTNFGFEGQASLFNNKKHCISCTFNSTESENFSRTIKQHVCELEYSEKVAEDFVTMVNSWKNKKANSFCASRSQKLRQAREGYQQGRVNIADVVKVERGIIEDIAWLIECRFNCSDEVFELADVIRNRQASCLGYTQLFYILGKSLGLSVIPVNVVELQVPGPLPAGDAHVACIVNLSDGRTIMLNLVPDCFISGPFIMEEKFTKVGDYLQLQDDGNPLNIYRKIQLLDKDGLTAYIYSNWGSVFASSGQYERALIDYTRAIELKANLAEAYNNRGIAYRNLGRLRQAVDDYTKAVELNPNHTEAYNNRGVAYSKLGQYERCISDYDKSIELNPDFAEAYNNRANAYVKMGQFERAISDYTRAIKNNSRLARAYGNRAVAYALLGQTKGAKKDLLKAAKLNPVLKPAFRRISDNFQLNLELD